MIEWPKRLFIRLSQNMLEIKAFRETKPRGVATLHKEPKDDVCQFYLYNARACENNMTTCTYDLFYKGKFCGFFSLSNFALELDRSDRKKQLMEKENITFTPPATKLGQLYIVKDFRDKGLGAEAIWNAIQMSLSSKSASRFLVLDVQNGKEYLFDVYAKFGWVRVSGMRTMFFDLLRYKIHRRRLKKIADLPAKEELKAFAELQRQERQQQRMPF